MSRKPNVLLERARQTEEFFRAQAAEYDRLAGLTTDAEIVGMLQRLAKAKRQTARRWQDRATTIEYAHLYDQGSEVES